MNRKIPSLITFFAAFVGYAQSAPVHAEVVCSADVSYRWIKEGGASPSDSSSAKESSGGGSQGEVKDTEKVDAKRSPPTESLVRFASIERRGNDEQLARAGLLIEVNRQKARAHERCKHDHESFGDCVSTKMAIKASTLNSLSFSARGKVEEALIDECRVQQGRCAAIESGEPVCRDLSAAQAAAAPDGGGDAKPVAGAKGEPAGDKAGGDKKPAEAAGDKGKAAKKKP